MEKYNEFLRTPEQDLLLKWGKQKRMRCMKKVQVKSGIGGVDVKIRRTTFRDDSEIPQAPRTPPGKPNFMNRTVYSSPEEVKVKVQKKNIHLMLDRVHTRGNNSNIKNGCSSAEDMNIVSADVEIMQEKGCDLAEFEWPKVVIDLSAKEKEEDFFVIKGSKLPQRPKRRPKFIQKNLHLVSPGSWLCDLSQERYEVREEKKNTKKRPRGLKAMVNIESDSD